LLKKRTLGRIGYFTIGKAVIGMIGIIYTSGINNPIAMGCTVAFPSLF